MLLVGRVELVKRAKNPHICIKDSYQFASESVDKLGHTAPDRRFLECLFFRFLLLC
jgi:hypothetical protein